MYLVQHGFQRGNKVDDAADAGTIDGVIWSPGDEQPATLTRAMNAPKLVELYQAVDPQMYVSPLMGANVKRLRDYAYFQPNLQSSDFTARIVLEIARDSLEFQRALPADVILAPTVAVDAVGERWAQIAISLAQAAIEEWETTDDDRPLFVSVASSHSILSNEEEVNGLLDDLTALECDGFYLLYEINPELGPPRHDDLLERSLWMTYSLAELNDYRVWVGYSGLSGYAHRAVGAEAFCTGWWQKLQWWSTNHWLEGGGGRAPRPRVVLQAILGSLLLEELSAIRRADRRLYDDIVSGAGSLAETLRDTSPARVDPSRDDQAAQLFAVCAALDERIDGMARDRLLRVLEDIDASTALHRRIQREGIALDHRSRGTKLASWRAALEGIAERIDLEL